MYGCIKYESNTLIFPKAIKRKLFFIHTDRQDVCKDGLYVCMDSGDILRPCIKTGGGIKIFT